MTAPDEPSDRIYFPELDGLRAVAFLMVFVFHGGIPQLPGWINALTPRWASKPPENLGQTIVSNGWAGVQIFFLLSGFLITTLLLREEKTYGKIDLKAFWMRRILRIWPLYYLVVLLTFFLIPLADGGLAQPDTRANLARQIVPFLSFCGNWSMGLIGPPPSDSISILWSVCVEEQFYLLCPLLIAWIRPRWRIGAVVALMAIGPICRWWMSVRLARAAISPLLFQFATTTHLDTLLGGVLLALMWPVRLSWPVRAGVLAGIAWLAFTPRLARGTTWHMTIDFEWIGLAGLGVVAWAASSRGLLPAILRYPRLVWLGKISYGLYMYHEIALALTKKGIDRLGWFPNREILQTIAGLSLTVLLASASYYGFERPFLRWKRKWSRVRSRPSP